MSSPRGSYVDQGKAIEAPSLWRCAIRYLEGQQVHSMIQRLESVTLSDLFRLLERLTSFVEYAELRLVQNLLVELKIVRDNTILQDSSIHESKLLKILKQSGRLGEFVSMILTISANPG